MDKDVNNAYEVLMNQILSGCKFMYFSYDHKKAIEEYRTSNEFELMRKFIQNPNSWDMPESLKEKYKIKQIGKLREIRFAPNGKAKMFKIGNKYSKSFRLDDFGVNVFPIS